MPLFYVEAGRLLAPGGVLALIRNLAPLTGFMTVRSCTYPWSNELAARGLIDLWLTRPTLWCIVRRIDWETTAKWARKWVDQEAGCWTTGLETSPLPARTSSLQTA